jgi:hypothetical protein
MKDPEIYFDASSELQASIEMMKELVGRLEAACRFYEQNNYFSTEHQISFAEIGQVDNLCYSTFITYLNLYSNLKGEWINTTMMQLKMTFTCGLYDHFAKKLSVLKKAFNITQAKSNLSISKQEIHNYMGNVYNVKQAMAVGDNAQVNNSTIINQAEINQLSKELQVLIDIVNKEPKSDEQTRSVLELSEAKQELEKGNKRGFVNILNKSGKWLFDIATKVGTNLLTEYIKHSQGL